MEVIKIIASAKEVMNSLILSFKEDLEKKENKDRYTKFDSDNDSFLGPLGEIVFKKYLEENGYKYGEDFKDNKILNKNDMTEINGKQYDHFDFKIKYGKQNLKIDVKTQYCINLNAYNEEWQMAVNSNTIDKIKNCKREIDYFVFIFCDKNVEEYKKHLKEKLKTENEIEIIDWLEENIEKASKYFKEIRLDIVGIIKTKHFIEASTLFKEKEIFRINFSKEGKERIWRSEANMYRIFIKFLTDIKKEISTKNLIYLNIEKKKEFKEWFEKIYVCKEDYLEVNIGNDIKIKVPVNSYLKGMQYKNYNIFYKENYDIFKKQLLS